MLVFRKGAWKEVNLKLCDPLFSENHKRVAASIAASSAKTGDALLAEVEEALYRRLFSLSGKEHRGPKN